MISSKGENADCDEPAEENVKTAGCGGCLVIGELASSGTIKVSS